MATETDQGREWKAPALSEFELALHGEMRMGLDEHAAASYRAAYLIPVLRGERTRASGADAYEAHLQAARVLRGWFARRADLPRIDLRVFVLDLGKPPAARLDVVERDLSNYSPHCVLYFRPPGSDVPEIQPFPPLVSLVVPEYENGWNAAQLYAEHIFQFLGLPAFSIAARRFIEGEQAPAPVPAPPIKTKTRKRKSPSPAR